MGNREGGRRHGTAAAGGFTPDRHPHGRRRAAHLHFAARLRLAALRGGRLEPDHVHRSSKKNSGTWKLQNKRIGKACHAKERSQYLFLSGFSGLDLAKQERVEATKKANQASAPCPLRQIEVCRKSRMSLWRNQWPACPYRTTKVPSFKRRTGGDEVVRTTISNRSRDLVFFSIR